MVENAKPAQNRSAAEIAIENARAARDSSTAAFEQRDRDGFLIVGNKELLVKRGFVIVNTEYRMNPDTGRETVYVQAVLDKGDKPIAFNDSSKGIFVQLSEYTGEFPVHVPNGLRKSEYTFRDEHGTGKGTTYYLDFAV